MDNNVLFLVLSFAISILGMLAFIVALIQRQVLVPKGAASSIFAPNEEGHSEANDVHLMRSTWRELDGSASGPILFYLYSSIFWLVLGSILGVLVSYKFQDPSFLGVHDFLTFGKLRPLHLNLITYGWLSLAGLGLGLWFVPRMTKVPLEYKGIIYAAGILWNAGIIAGSIGILYGYTDGMEWLEFWWPVDIFLAIAGGLTVIPLFKSIFKSTEEHLYVSMWYTICAFIWFPCLFIIANSHWLHTGVEQGIANWWFAHNVLGLWVTPLGLAVIYYLLPKITGFPIASYQLSLFGFWGLALFYAQVGGHHLLGGPIPTWLGNLSVVMSAGMIIPVVTVAINHHVSTYRHFGVLRESVVLRFIVFGAMMYTLSSLQGSLHAFRTLNEVTHFTHWTVAHAHLGLYGFTSMVFFGGIYFAMPRLLNRNWPWPGLLNAHFWIASSGIIIYVISLSIGGILQGLELISASGTFQQSLEVTTPYLAIRTLGGTLMLASHLLLLWNVLGIALFKEVDHE